jgi:hypothetical protein
MNKSTIAALAALGAAGALMSTQVPEIKRYLKIRGM